MSSFLRPLSAIARSGAASHRPAAAYSSRLFHTTRANMVVHNVHTADEFKQVLKDHPLVVVDCFATWCGPCKAIAPKLVEYSNQHPNAHFVKIDVDEVPDLSAELGVRAMPTFYFFKDGDKVDEIVGAAPNPIQQAIVKLTEA